MKLNKSLIAGLNWADAFTLFVRNVEFRIR
jgi:hypothetical protein